MFSKRKRHSSPKEAILRGIYQDNLKIAGKRVEGARPAKQAFVLRRLQWLLVVLAVTLCSFSELDPSLTVYGEGTQMARPTAPVRIDDAVSFPESDSAWHLAIAEPGRENLQALIPIWDYSAPGDQTLKDYSLLLSREDHVRLSSLFGLDIKTIVIDPGHGGADPGAIGAMGIKEKDITLDVALKLKERLHRLGSYTVLLTRDRDLTLSLAKRVEFAKEKKADIFISVHVNSLPNQTINVIETYYFGPPLNAETLQLAEQENIGSHYTLGELNAIIQDIGNTLKRQESAMLAASIQKSLFRNVKHHDAQVRDVGIKMAPFIVLSQVEVPSVLVEISCLTKEEEEAKLASPKYREKIASFMEEGIVAYLETQHFKTISGEN